MQESSFYASLPDRFIEANRAEQQLQAITPRYLKDAFPDIGYEPLQTRVDMSKLPKIIGGIDMSKIAATLSEDYLETYKGLLD